MADYTRAAVLVWCLGVSTMAAWTAPGTVVLDPALDIAGVIKGVTRPEVVVRGLRSADDPLPGVGLIFTESAQNRIGRLGDDGRVMTFIGDLRGPLGQTVDRRGRLISLQTQKGFRGGARVGSVIPVSGTAPLRPDGHTA
jgi:hypothetical protein